MIQTIYFKGCRNIFWTIDREKLFAISKSNEDHPVCSASKVLPVSQLPIGAGILTSSLLTNTFLFCEQTSHLFLRLTDRHNKVKLSNCS